MYIAYLLANMLLTFIPWCAEDPYFYYTDSDAEAIPEDPQPGQEDEEREWCVDDREWCVDDLDLSCLDQ